jgi:hypothetical protein
MRSTVALLVAAGIVAWAVGGCGGGGGPGQSQYPPAGKGVLRGQVVIFGHEELPVTGVAVRATMGSSVVQTTTVNSWFDLVVAPGTYTVTVVPPEGFALPPGGEQVEATAWQGIITTLPEPFVLIEETDLPPGTP